MNTILIKNGTVVTLDDENRVLFQQDVLIEDGKVSKIADTDAFVCDCDQVIDATNKIVMPGFINAHTHFYSAFAKGLTTVAPANSFIEVLENLWWRLDRQLTLEDSYYSTLVSILEGIRHGTTTFIDHHASAHAIKGSLQQIAKAVLKTGVRACLCYEVSDRDGKQITYEGMEENLEFIQHCNTHSNDYVKALFGLHASFTVSDQTLYEAATSADKLNTGFHIHAAESQYDQEMTLKMSAQRVVERLYSHGILGPKTIAAHCVDVNESEIDALKETDTIVIYNPQSNLNNAVGIADILPLMQKGILVGLGTDAMTTNMLEECRNGLWSQHLKNQAPHCGFLEVTKTLLHNNAKIVQRIWEKDSFGSIKENDPADVILVDYIPSTPLNSDNILGHIVFGISQATVDTTIVNGKILMQNKKLSLDLDESALYAKSRELANGLWKRFEG